MNRKVETASEPEIHVSSHRIADSYTHLTLTANKGFLTAIYSEGSGKFGITYVRVEPDARKNGTGQELLSKSVEVATELGACVMHATIISRESLEACRRVFGDDSVIVNQEGAFEAEDGMMPDAQLWHVLSQ